MAKEFLYGKTLGELQTVCAELQLPRFVAKQIADWLYRKNVRTIDEMTNLSKVARAALSERFELGLHVPEGEQTSSDGTKKYLYRTSEDEFVESAYIPDRERATLCVSSQAGCRMGCRFCASTIGGRVRDLGADELLGQVIAASRDTGERVSNIVMMGIGEPLDNYDNVLKMLELITDEKGQNMSMRHISLSTCGIVPRIYQLADEKLGLTLSISLHAPNNNIRGKSMPINKKYDVDVLLSACRKYAGETSRRISFEYSMLSGFNDTDECACELGKRLKGMLCHVNLIPVNSVKERNYKKRKYNN